MVKQTAGRDALNDFAPKFAELNDDVLFGEVWSREDKLSARDRSIVTVTALMAGGILDSSLKFHLQNAKIMVVDDDAEIREVIRILLESEGCEIVEAENGAKAVE